MDGTTSTQLCPPIPIDFFRRMNRVVWQINGLMLLNAVLMGVVVCVGAYAPRYRRHPLIGLLFLGSTTLFLPIVSNVSSAANQDYVSFHIHTPQGAPFLQVLADCHMKHDQIALILVWTGLVLIIGINTSAIVACDTREGKSIDPPTELLVQATWLAYLAYSTRLFYLYSGQKIIFHLFIIIFTKLLLKYSLFYMSRRSFALGRNPRLIAGYMAHQLRKHLGEIHTTLPQIDGNSVLPAPALIVMGEDNVQVQKQPYGYSFRQTPEQQRDRPRSSSRRLVTLDNVWSLDDTFLEPKRLCFSFALFKLPRCRFAKYTILEAGFLDAHEFFRQTYLQGDNHKEVFGLLADEISFIHDYYYSSIPIFYAHHLLTIFCIALPLYCIAYCLCLIIFVASLVGSNQISCVKTCNKTYADDILAFGNSYFEVVAILLVLAVLLLSETRNIISHICSNWTKVALIYHYINYASWQRSPIVRKCIASVFKYCRCKLVKSWKDKMNQCSILELHPRKTTTTLLLRCLFRLHGRKKKIKVPRAVMSSIFQALKEGLTVEQGIITQKHIRPPSSPISGSVLEMDTSSLSEDHKHIAYSILVWHIATTLFEVRHPEQSDPEGNKIAATHLSRYCAYLVSSCPQLVPDDDEWCKSLYKDVKEEADRVLAAAPGVEYQQLVRLLSSNAKHEVLRNSANLATQLVDSGKGWAALAQFWAEMILYVAPSENLEGHADAIAFGGELITLIWALLGHAGIVGRLDVHADTATNSGQV